MVFTQAAKAGQFLQAWLAALIFSQIIQRHGDGLIVWMTFFRGHGYKVVCLAKKENPFLVIRLAIHGN